MITVNIDGVGVIAPGLLGWSSGVSVLRGAAPYAATECEPPPPATLNPRERRRVSAVVRLALAAADDACGHATTPPTELSSVFASSLGDSILLNSLLTALADPNGKVSPTQFHNSVHNAAAGYWTIGTGNQQSCTSIAAHDFTFAMGLLKAAVQSASERRSVLLTVFDHPFPEPLNQARPLLAPFAAGIVMTDGNGPSSGLGRLSIQLAIDATATPPRTLALRDLWTANPAARALPLLEVIALKEPAELYIESGDDQCLRLDYSPR